MAKFHCFALLWLCAAVARGQVAAPPTLKAGDKFAARDTLACADDDSEDAAECLAGLSWTPAEFTVQLEAAQAGQGDWLVRFPSAKPIGNEKNDLASMEWFVGRDSDGKIKQARAVVVVHESGRGMTVGRIVARGLNSHGLHAFMLHLPGYGARRVDGLSDIKRAIPALQQAIADVRRARDAVATLPLVDDSVIGVQGTSLGGFVTATVAGLDLGYDRVFIFLAGGNLHDVLLSGAKDAARTREKLRAAGVTDEQIVAAARNVEPLRLAHRIDPSRVWLYSGQYDDVVPPSCSLALAKTARLADGHHIVLPVDHYSGAFYLPQVVKEMYEHMETPGG